MTRQLVLCRHTQTDHNRDRIYSGQLDVPLNDTGKDQADRLAERIAALDGVCAVLCSDLIRTTAVGTRISGKSEVPLRLTSDLREAHVGRLQGLTREQFPPQFQGERFRTSNPDFDFTSIGGERADEVIARCMRALRKVGRYFELRHAPVTRVVIVGHGTALRLVFRDHLGLIDALHEQGEYQEVPWTL